MLKLENRYLLGNSNLINKIYNINDNSCLYEWRFNVLKFILPLFRAAGVSFFLSDKEQKKLDFQNGTVCGLDSSRLAEYQQYYQNHDPFREVVYSNLTCATDKMFPRQWENSLYYNDLLRPWQVSHELIICIRSRNRLYGKIGIFRQVGSPCFNDRDQAIALFIAKHLECVIKNINLAKVYKDEINIYKEIDEFPLRGIIVLDFDFKLVYCNEIAEKICWTIGEKEGAINNNLRQQNVSIPCEVIQDCQDLKFHFQLGQVVVPYFRVSDIYVNQDRRYKSRSFLDTWTSNGRKTPSFVILFEDRAEVRQIRERTAMFKYKLSMRELEICNLVREGLTNKEVSGELFISLCTVETHLRNIFKKTKANNRAELVKLLDCCY